MTVEGASARTPASGPNMFRLILSLPINDTNREIIGEMLLQMRQKVFVGFGFMQGALNFDAAAAAVDEPDPHLATSMPSVAIPYVIQQSGDVTFPHKFVKPRRGGVPGLCIACELVEGHAIHWPESIALRKEHGDDAIRQMVDERKNSTNGHAAPATDEPELSPEAAQLIEQIPPSDSRHEVDPDEAAQAEHNLASGSQP